MKMANRFSEGLNKLKGVAEPTSSVSHTSDSDQAAFPQSNGIAESSRMKFRYVQENRRGKVVISAYFDPAVRKQLALLAIEKEKTQAALLAEALNLLFEKYSRPPIAKA